jgi:hypothetical protein
MSYSSGSPSQKVTVPVPQHCLYNEERYRMMVSYQQNHESFSQGCEYGSAPNLNCWIRIYVFQFHKSLFSAYRPFLGTYGTGGDRQPIVLSQGYKEF